MMATLFACVAVALLVSVSASPNVPCLNANGIPVCKALRSKADCQKPHAGEASCCYWNYAHCYEVTTVVQQQRRIYNGMKSLARTSSSLSLSRTLSLSDSSVTIASDTSSLYFPDAYDAVKRSELRGSKVKSKLDGAEDIKPIPIPWGKFEADVTSSCGMFNNKKDCDFRGILRKPSDRKIGPCMTTDAQVGACKSYGCQVEKLSSWNKKYAGVCVDAPSTPAPKPPASADGDGASAVASGDASSGASDDDASKDGASSGGANSLSQEDREAIQRRAQLSNAFGGCTKSSAGRDCRAFIIGDVGSGGTRFDIYYYTPYKISLGSQHNAATGMYAAKLCQCAKEDKNNADHLTNLDLIGREKTGPERQARANKIFKYLFDRCISSIVNEPACMPLAEALGADVLGFTNPFSDWNESQRSAVHDTADYILEHMPLYLEATAGLREFMIHQPDGEAGVQEIWDRSLDAIRSQSQWKLDDKDFVGKVIEGRFEGYFGMISGFQYLESKPDIFDCVKGHRTNSGSESASASGPDSGSSSSVGLRRESNLAEAPGKAKCQHDNVIFLEIGGASQQIAWSIPRALRSKICRAGSAAAPASSLLSMSEQLRSAVTPNPMFHPEELDHIPEEEALADTVLLETETETQTEGIMKVHFPLDPTDRKGISYVYSRSVLGDGNDRTGIQVLERAIKAKFPDLSTLKPVNAEFFHSGIHGGGASSAAPASGPSTTSLLEVESAPVSKVATSSADDEDSGDDDSDDSSSGASSSGGSSSGGSSSGASSSGASSSGSPTTPSGGGSSSSAPSTGPSGPVNVNDKNVVAIPCWAKGANLMIDGEAYVTLAANSPNGTVEQNELAGVLRWGFDQKFLGDVVLSDTIRTFLTAQFDNGRTGFLYGTGDLEGCRKAVEDWIVHGDDDTKTNRKYGDEFSDTKKELLKLRYNFATYANDVLVSFKPYSFLYAKAVKKGQVKMPMDAADVKKLSDISCSRDAEASDPFSFSPCQVTVFLEKLLQHYGILDLNNARVHVTNQVNWPDAAANFHAEVRSIVKPKYRNLFEVKAFNPHDPNKAENEGQYCVRLLSNYTNSDMDREDDYYKSVSEQFDDLKEGLNDMLKKGLSRMKAWAKPLFTKSKSHSTIETKIVRGDPCHALKRFGEMTEAVKKPRRFHAVFCLLYQTRGKPEQKLDEFCKDREDSSKAKEALKDEIKSGWKEIWSVMEAGCSLR